MKEIELEQKVIQTFIREDKRDRFIGFLQKDKHRPKFLKELFHGQIFRADLFKPIEGPDEIRNAIKALGIKDCYIISENRSIDGRRLEMDTALREAIAPWADTGTILVFGDAQVIYREQEGPGNKWIGKGPSE